MLPFRVKGGSNLNSGITVIQLLLVRTSFSGRAGEPAPTTLYAARGRLIPFNSNSPTGSTFTALSTFVSTRGQIRICPA